MIKAVYTRCMNDDVSVRVTKYEPRIALIRKPGLGFDDNACLDKRMLDAIKLRELVVRPSACRGNPPRPREYRATHDVLTLLMCLPIPWLRFKVAFELAHITCRKAALARAPGGGAAGTEQAAREARSP